MSDVCKKAFFCRQVRDKNQREKEEKTDFDGVWMTEIKIPGWPETVCIINNQSTCKLTRKLEKKNNMANILKLN